MSRSSRREALALAALGALAAAAPASALPPGASPLWELLSVERQIVAGYSAALERDLTGVDATRLLERLLREEQRHVAAIEEALGTIGADVPAPSGRFVVRETEAARSERELLEFALETEEIAVAAHVDAAQGLTRADHLALVARSTAAHGRHLVSLRLALGRPPLGPAFETGEH